MNVEVRSDGTRPEKGERRLGGKELGLDWLKCAVPASEVVEMTAIDSMKSKQL